MIWRIDIKVVCECGLRQRSEGKLKVGMKIGMKED